MKTSMSRFRTLERNLGVMATYNKQVWIMLHDPSNGVQHHWQSHASDFRKTGKTGHLADFENQTIKLFYAIQEHRFERKRRLVAQKLKLRVPVNGCDIDHHGVFGFSDSMAI